MPGPSLTLTARVIDFPVPTETMRRLTLFTAEQGLLLAYQRLPGKSPARRTALELFDVAELHLQGAPSGDAWFVQEARLLQRPSGLGRTFAILTRASALAALIGRNPIPPESRQPLWRLLDTACAAFAETDQPDLVYFKSLYVFARDEGYPVRAQWLANLSAAPRAEALHLLNTPLAELPAPPPVAPHLLSLENYLRTHTELLLP